MKDKKTKKSSSSQEKEKEEQPTAQDILYQLSNQAEYRYLLLSRIDTLNKILKGVWEELTEANEISRKRNQLLEEEESEDSDEEEEDEEED